MNEPVDLPLLSIVVPCHNSLGRMARLATRLTSLDDADVECILVDDGSTDGTPTHLEDIRRKMRCPCVVLTQENKGPGGAKNSGLARARGTYVWFVDSDDDIDPRAIAELRRLQSSNYDFIDFEVVHVADTAGPVRRSIGAKAGALQLTEGDYRAADVTRLALLRSVGWLWTKIFRREFLLNHGFNFPEHCIYEDTVWLFWLPLTVDRFYKSGIVGYYHDHTTESVTRDRGRRPARFYDRLLTASLSVELASVYRCTPEERQRIEDKFTKIFLVHTLQMLAQSRDWAMMPRVVRFYRGEANRLGIGRRSRRRSLRKMPTLIPLWLSSHFYSSQAECFRELHRRAWNRDVRFAPPSAEVQPVRA